jgi:hypothetical protein
VRRPGSEYATFVSQGALQSSRFAAVDSSTDAFLRCNGGRSRRTSPGSEFPTDMKHDSNERCCPCLFTVAQRAHRARIALASQTSSSASGPRSIVGAEGPDDGIARDDPQGRLQPGPSQVLGHITMSPFPFLDYIIGDDSLDGC